jgi:VanZ family protein
MGSLKTSYLTATVLYCAAIFWLSQQSELPLPQNDAFVFPGLDKVVHCLMYGGGLTALLSTGIRESNDPAKGWVQWFVPVGFAILYGLSDEMHQIYVP